MKSGHMKHPIIAIAALSALALTACGSSDSPGTDTGGTAPGGSAAAAGVSLVNDGKLTVCTHLPYAPFQSNDDSGKTVGFDVDMMDLVAKKLGVEQAIVDTPFEGIKSGQDMATGKCDISAAGHDHHARSGRRPSSSRSPTSTRRRRCSSRPGRRSKSLADLKGKKLGAQSSTTGLDYANKHKAECGCEIIEFQDLAAETQALLTGQVDAAINDLPVWSEAIKQNPGKAQHRDPVRHRRAVRLRHEARQHRP